MDQFASFALKALMIGIWVVGTVSLGSMYYVLITYPDLGREVMRASCVKFGVLAALEAALLYRLDNAGLVSAAFLGFVLNLYLQQDKSEMCSKGWW
jgi:hypothetical protein